MFNFLDKLIHSIPILPRKLQDSWLDRLWESISKIKSSRICYHCKEIIPDNKTAYGSGINPDCPIFICGECFEELFEF